MNKKLALITVSIFFTITSAHAYIDPGTGSIVLQAIIGVIAAVATFLKVYWHKFLKLLRITKKIFINKKNEKD